MELEKRRREEAAARGEMPEYMKRYGITPEQWKAWQTDGAEPDASAPEAK